MNRNTIRWIIVAASMLLFGLVLIQIFWVKKAYDIEQKQFSYDVTESLKKVVRQIQLNSKDSVPIYDPVEQASSNYFRVRIHDTLHPFYLEALLKNQFKKDEINLGFEYSIYDCFNDSVVYQRTVNQSAVVTESASNSPDFNWNNDDGHYFSVYFPNKSGDLFSKMEFWIYSSLFLVIVVFFFGYTISVILRQRRISEIKTDFINNMTHEFKTPISTIALSSEVLLKPSIIEKPEKLKNYAQIIYNENQRLQAQVERILQIATIEKENIRLRSKPVSVNEIVSQAAKTFELNAQAKGGYITTNLKAQKDVVQGDEMHLINIVSNLIDNAIKYTFNEPVVELSTYQSEKGIYITVKDNGVGINKVDAAQVFDKFYRVPKGNVHDVKGFGIGLHYVKVMTEQHGGKITLDSVPDKGSTFKIFLPFHHE